ncbi:MAG: hypothetical protein IJT54_05175 [Candidatus Methanomethylophilaceae archaeon]|nr:hypothetical protein [Candidatus Methanomethylophilaceae archaeon]
MTLWGEKAVMDALSATEGMSARDIANVVYNTTTSNNQQISYICRVLRKLEENGKASIIETKPNGRNNRPTHYWRYAL